MKKIVGILLSAAFVVAVVFVAMRWSVTRNLLTPPAAS